MYEVPPISTKVFTHSPKTCKFRRIEVSKYPICLSVRLNSVYVCPGMDW